MCLAYGSCLLSSAERGDPRWGHIGTPRTAGDPLTRLGAGGSLADLQAGRDASDLPVLRKDFTVDPYQVYETRAAGADALLLVVGALEPRELGALYGVARGLDLDVLVEVHDERELDRAMQTAAPSILGVNNRDLTTLEVDTRRTFELRPRIPESATVVAESGFSRPEQMDELEAAGIDAVLIGEALMRSADIERACRALTAPTM